MKTKLLACLGACWLLAATAFAQQPTPTVKPMAPPAPALHELVQGDKFPLAVPVPETPDPTRLYKEALQIIAREHIALAGYEPPEFSLSGIFGGSRPQPKTKMQAFLDKWEKPPFELKTLDDADKAVKMALESLDHRFDSYLVPKDVKLEDKRIDNTNVGIGILIKMEGMDELLKTLPKDATEEQVNKVLIVSEKNFLSVTPVRNGPAAKGGVLEGDIIREVDGKAISGMPYTEVMKLIGGKKGSVVEIGVERTENGAKVTKKLKITRNEFEVPVVTLKHVGNDIWHLHLETFAARNAAKDVKEALDEVVKKGGKGLIFDLRDNGGGLVDQAIDIAMFMLPDGPIVAQEHRLYGGAETVKTESRVTPHLFMETRAQPGGGLPITRQRVLAVPAEMPIVVLVNGNSASASELVSGCLKFNNRVKVVGVRTFGKGVGQALLDLPYGRRLHVTSFYFLPANRFTDWVGVEVDVEVKADKGENAKDNQLEEAVKVVTKMYEDGIKERADKVKHDEDIRKENRELWKQRMERMQKMKDEAEKKAKEKNAPPAENKDGEKKPEGGNGTAPATTKPEDGKKDPGTVKPGDDKPADATKPEEQSAPTVDPTPNTEPGEEKPKVEESPSGSDPKVDPKPTSNPGEVTPNGTGN